jgi:replicative DNA helicase
VAQETNPSLRLPPQSIEAEQSVLGGLLLDNDAWSRMGDVLSEADFYRDDHRRIYRHIAGLIEKSRPADVVTVFESIEKANEMDQTGGLAYLGEIANNTPSAANIRHYAHIVREKAILRRLIGTCDEIAGQALNPAGQDAIEILDDAERRIFQVAEAGASARAQVIPLQEALGQAIDRVSQLFDQDEHDGVTGIATGYVDLDRMTAGLQRGDMIVVAGRPSMGKTALAMNIAEHVAVDLNLPVLIFSLEMSAPQLAMRFLASRARIDLARLRRGQLSDEDWEKITYGLSKLAQAPVRIDENGMLTVNEMRARARRVHREFGQLGLIVIDYIQLIATPQATENRATELGAISRMIKGLAKDLDVPIIALSQLSRKVEERTDKRPMMSDLRESGAIEQDADVIMMLYRDEYYTRDACKETGITEVIIGKQRNGPTGDVRLTFLAEYCRFENLAMPGAGIH